MTVKPGDDPAVVEKALDEELAKFLPRGRRAAELERVRTTNYADFVRGLERIDGFGGKSYILAESQVFGGSPDFYKTRLDWVAAATPADVRGAAQRWLSDGVFVLNVEPVAGVQGRRHRRRSQQAAGRRRAAGAQTAAAAARQARRTACRWWWSSGTTRRWSTSR